MQPTHHHEHTGTVLTGLCPRCPTYVPVASGLIRGDDVLFASVRYEGSVFSSDRLRYVPSARRLLPGSSACLCPSKEADPTAIMQHFNAQAVIPHMLSASVLTQSTLSHCYFCSHQPVCRASTFIPKSHVNWGTQAQIAHACSSVAFCTMLGSWRFFLFSDGKALKQRVDMKRRLIY